MKRKFGNCGVFFILKIYSGNEREDLGHKNYERECDRNKNEASTGGRKIARDKSFAYVLRALDSFGLYEKRDLVKIILRYFLIRLYKCDHIGKLSVT
jgi:hypothetical protein